MGIDIRHAGSTLPTVKATTPRLHEVAEMGRIGAGSMSIDNSAGTLEIIGHKAWRATEDACAVQNIVRGFMGDRRYKRDIERAGASRIIEADLLDLNAKLGFKVLRGAAWRKRPKNETIGERLTDLLASGFLNVEDNGFVNYPDIALDRADLRGQRPGDVLMEMATRAGFNFFVYYDEAEDDASLWFQDSNTSTDWSATIRISNVIADLDDDTFEASLDTELRRSPAQTVSGVWMPFAKGNVYRTRSETEDTYEPRDGTAPNANVKRRARARNRADKFLFQHRNEEDRITTTIQVPATKVNLARAGQRISCRFSHFAQEGYGSFSWFRILERTVVPLVAPDEDLYNVSMVLSPQEPAEVVASMVQCQSTFSAAETTVTMDSDVTIGNLLVSRLITRNNETIPSMFDGSWTLLASGAATGQNTHGAVAMYGKIADSTSPIIEREATAEQMQMTVCEIAGADLGDVTAFSATHQTTSTCNLGSGTGTLGLWIIAIPRGSDQARNGYTVSPSTGWSVEKNQDIDNAAACASGPADPWWWAAKIEDQTTVDILANIAVTGGGGVCDGQVLTEWCAAAIFV